MTLKQVKQAWKKSIFQCRKGYFIWHNLMKKHPEIQNTYVILMPSCEDSYNYYALLYINQLLRNSERENAVILTHDKRVLNEAKKFSPNIISVIPFSRKKAELLMKYISLYEFDNRLIVASLEEPIGRNGRQLIGLKGLTEEEVFVIGVYKIFPFVKEDISWSSSLVQNFKNVQ